MELGQRLRQSRLEAGLTQRQLCGNTITRNMLSQIENGTARPSMDTLRYLAEQLGKPLSYFLEEDAVLSPNLSLMEEARLAYAHGQFGNVLEILRTYHAPDPVSDPEMGLLKVLSLLQLAETALEEGKTPYAHELLSRVTQEAGTTPYFTAELRRKQLLLLAETQPGHRDDLLSQLPDNDRELLLRAESALHAEAYVRCRSFLDVVSNKTTPRWYFLQGEAAFGLGDYAEAAKFYGLLEKTDPAKAIPRLELCYQKLEDYKSAYLYACKLRQLPRHSAGG